MQKLLKVKPQSNIHGNIKGAGKGISKNVRRRQQSIWEFWTLRRG